jgi:hypothetical protein
MSTMLFEYPRVTAVLEVVVKLETTNALVVFDSYRSVELFDR